MWSRFGSTTTSAREKKISMDLCRAIISAHRHGIKVLAHIHYLEDAKQLVEAGLDGLGHSVRDKPVDEQLIASMKKRGAWQPLPRPSTGVSTFVYAKPHPFWTTRSSLDRFLPRCSLP
jgi:imidazolonepropionase-like amidohydrolase